jgi:hypothetical protein
LIPRTHPGQRVERVLVQLLCGTAEFHPLPIDSSATKDTSSPCPSSWVTRQGVWGAVLPAPCHGFVRPGNDTPACSRHPGQHVGATCPRHHRGHARSSPNFLDPSTRPAKSNSPSNTSSTRPTRDQSPRVLACNGVEGRDCLQSPFLCSSSPFVTVDVQC